MLVKLGENGCFVDLGYNYKSGLVFFPQKRSLILPMFLFTQDLTLDTHFIKMYAHAYFNNNKRTRIVVQQ